MAVINLPTLVYFGPHASAYNQSGGSALSVDGDKFAMIFPVPATGDISKLIFRVYAVSSSQTMKVSLQGIGADGNATGTILGATQNGYGTFTPSAAVLTVTLGEVVPVTKNQAVAMVFEFTGTTGNVQICIGTTELGVAFYSSVNMCYQHLYTASAWATKTYPGGGLMVTPVYSVNSVDTYYPSNPLITVPHASGTRLSLSNATTPDQIATKMIAPFTMRAAGILARTTLAPTDNLDLVLYASDGTTVLGSASVNDATSAANLVGFFSSSVTITKGQTVYIAIKPTTTTVVTNGLHYFTYASTDVMGALPWGASTFIYSQNTDGGAWTDTTTRTAPIGLLLDGITAYDMYPFVVNP